MAQAARTMMEGRHMAQPRVFVSHSHKDDAFTGQMVADLRAAGADVWVEVANMGSGDFQKRINEALSRCDWVVVVLTQDALNSPWVEQEVNAAIRLKHQGQIRDVLPIRAGLVDLKTLPPLWGVFNVFDATRDYAGACTEVLRTLGLPAAVAQHMESAADLVARGTEFQGRGMHAAALRFFDRALARDPNCTDAWYNKGLALRILGRHEEELAAYDMALARDPSYLDVWCSKGFTCLYLHRYLEGITAMEQALALDPNSNSALGGIGFAMRKLGRWEEALAVADKRLALDPNNRSQWSDKGRALEELKRYEEALEAYERALALDPSWAHDWDSKGAVLNNLERHEEALVALNRALVLGETAIRWNNKAVALRGLGRTREAEEAERRAKELGW
jgi:tetratricopeptide (TPR) repeat protein